VPNTITVYIFKALLYIIYITKVFWGLRGLSIPVSLYTCYVKKQQVLKCVKHEYVLDSKLTD